jgi:cell wall-associated NlpC family hydrolase
MAKKKKVDTRHLMHAVCPISVIAVRLKPDDLQSMVTQMLFGETCVILEKKNKHWCKVQTHHCQVTGWVRAIQLDLIDEKTYNKLNHHPAVALDICNPVMSEDISMSVLLGSTLPCFDGISCQMPDRTFVYNGQAAIYGDLHFSHDLLVKLARRYLHSPELAGGRSPFGIDAPALVQQVFRFFTISLPRYAHEQFLYGEAVDFVELAREGDVVFCHDEDGKINHTGIVVGEKRILHVYGQVRIDKFDHHGIYHTSLQKYTHKLRMIKRLALPVLSPS